MSSANVSVQVELPRDLVGSTAPEALRLELRLLWAVEQVRTGRLGVGRAAGIAGMPRAAFMVVLGEHGVPVMDYPADELAAELKDVDAA